MKLDEGEYTTIDLIELDSPKRSIQIQKKEIAELQHLNGALIDFLKYKSMYHEFKLFNEPPELLG